MTHPHVVFTQVNSADAVGVEELLSASRTFGVMAGWVSTYVDYAGGTH